MDITVTIIVSFAVALIYVFIIKPKQDKKASEAMKYQADADTPSSKEYEPPHQNNLIKEPMSEGRKGFPLFKDASEVKREMEKTYNNVYYDSATSTVFCKEAPFLVVQGELIYHEEITEISVYCWKGYYDKHGNLVADSDDDDYVVIYDDDYDYSEYHYSVVIKYKRDDLEKRIQVRLDDYWAKEIELYK